ncbi:putative maltokinase [Devosia submarina]|uniref:putative maltokinase n=1 Tax=Devosia submarina TaxID=1173082 RepID=UPI001300B582|nr:putative maltokinase [Devosia submarina]
MTGASSGAAAEPAVELATIELSGNSILAVLDGPEAQQIQAYTLPNFLPRQRWFGAKDSAIKSVVLLPLGELEAGRHALVAADVALATETQRYLLPLSALWDEGTTRSASRFTPVLARLRSDARSGVLIDSALEPHLATTLLDAMRARRTIASDLGNVVFEAADGLVALAEIGEPRHLGAEQSNVSIAFGSKVILKLYRRLRAGDQPDVEVARFLTKIGHFANTPQFMGQIRHETQQGERTTLAAAFAFVPNQGDAWTVITEALYQDLNDKGLLDASTSEGATGKTQFNQSLRVGELLGRRTAELHKALAVETDDPAFAVEPLSSADVLVWSSEAIVEAQAALDQLLEVQASLPAGARELATKILAKRNQLIERLGAGAGMTPSGGRSRIHGDYHLGQVLATADDFMIIDFEGEPRRTLKERQAKSSPLRDVAGMLRSFHYAAWTAIDRYQRLTGAEDVRERAEAWRKQVSADFVRAYEEHIAGAPSYPQDPVFARALTEMFLLQKAIYEVGYELSNRPDWVEIPLSGVLDLLNEG